jgi:hypothetical protein
VWLDYFDRVYCIHLPNDARREAVQKQFDSVAKDFSMNNMRRGARGEFGCSLSHIAAAVEAIADRAKRPIFFEDDVTFRADTVDDMRAAISELPMIWDVLYLGGHPRSPAQKFSEHLAKIGTFSFAEAYAVRGWVLPRWIQFWCNRVGQKNAMVDLILGEFAAENEGFCVYPLITYQPPGISQISGKHDDKSNCLNKGWQNNLSTKSQ